jgi:hypothetical protein
MGMVQALSRVQKMEIRHIFIPAPTRLATCLHVQKAGLLAGLAHLYPRLVLYHPLSPADEDVVSTLVHSTRICKSSL